VTTTNSMVGTTLAAVYASDSSPTPTAAASAAVRASPVARDTSVPAAIDSDGDQRCRLVAVVVTAG
jgi:hypothetical protein